MFFILRSPPLVHFNGLIIFDNVFSSFDDILIFNISTVQFKPLAPFSVCVFFLLFPFLIHATVGRYLMATVKASATTICFIIHFITPTLNSNFYRLLIILVVDLLSKVSLNSVFVSVFISGFFYFLFLGVFALWFVRLVNFGFILAIDLMCHS